MKRTKQQIIDRAFTLIGKNPNVVDIEPEEYLDALTLLEAMMNDWYDLNIQVGWTSPDASTAADLVIDSGLPDRAFSAVWTNLALKIAPEFGKQVSREVKAEAHTSYRRLLAHYNKPVPRKRLSMPAGAGNKNSGTFLPQDTDDSVVFTPEPNVRFIND